MLQPCTRLDKGSVSKVKAVHVCEALVETRRCLKASYLPSGILVTAVDPVQQLCETRSKLYSSMQHLVRMVIFGVLAPRCSRQPGRQGQLQAHVIVTFAIKG